MRFTILTLFPEMIEPVITSSILGRAQEKGIVEIVVRNLRDWATDSHKTVDDSPYGGGAGMVLKVDVVDRALADLQSSIINHQSSIILLTPQGKQFNQSKAKSLAEAGNDLILIAGHYEGFDERIRSLVDEEISIGDYVLTGGELPALVVADAVTRLLPGVLGSSESPNEESFSLKANEANQASKLLEYPHFTRPDTYTPISRNTGPLRVPEILKSGHHASIATWRSEQALERTKRRRPDLLEE